MLGSVNTSESSHNTLLVGDEEKWWQHAALPDSCVDLEQVVVFCLSAWLCLGICFKRFWWLFLVFYWHCILS